MGQLTHSTGKAGEHVHRYLLVILPLDSCFPAHRGHGKEEAAFSSFSHHKHSDNDTNVLVYSANMWKDLITWILCNEKFSPHY